MRIISTFHSHKGRSRWYILKHCTNHKGLFRSTVKIQSREPGIVAYVHHLSTQRLRQEGCHKLDCLGNTVSLRLAQTIKTKLFLKKQCWHECYRSNQLFFIGLQAHFKEKLHVWYSKSGRIPWFDYSSNPRGEPTTIISLGIVSNWPLNTHFYIHKLMQLSVLIREVSWGSGFQLI